MPKDELKIQGYVPLYNVWALQGLVDAGHVGVNKNDAVSNIVLQWFRDNDKLVRECRLTTADFAKATKKMGGPKGIVPFPESPPSAPRPPESPSDRTDEPVDRLRIRAVARCRGAGT